MSRKEADRMEAAPDAAPSPPDSQDDRVDRAGEDSFPASDPPPWTPRTALGAPARARGRREEQSPPGHSEGEAAAPEESRPTAPEEV